MLFSENCFVFEIKWEKSVQQDTEDMIL